MLMFNCSYLGKVSLPSVRARNSDATPLARDPGRQPSTLECERARWTGKQTFQYSI